MVGIIMFGLSAAYSGVLCSPLEKSSGRTVTSRPRWLASAIALKARGLGGNAKISMVMMLSPVVDSSSPDEARSADIRERPSPHVASLMRATSYKLTLSPHTHGTSPA